MEKIQLTPLPYSHDALEPVIGAQTVAVHHGKHLQTYVNNLNALIEGELFLLCRFCFCSYRVFIFVLILFVKLPIYIIGEIEIGNLFTQLSA